MGDTWYYSKGGAEQHGPVTQAEIQRLLASGELRPGDLVWTEGMAEWAPASSRPELRAAPAPAAAPVAVARLPEGLLGWATFVGVMNIVGGVFQCLTCFGIIIGIPMIVAGAALLGAKSALESVPSVESALSPFFTKFKSYVTATGVVFIIGLVGAVIMLIVYFGAFAAAFSHAARGN